MRGRPPIVPSPGREAELAARQRQDDAVVGSLLHEVAEVAAARTRTVAAAHKEETADGALLHRVDHGVGHAEDGAVAEARGERAGRIGCSRITAQLQRTLDERLEVFPAVGRSLNVHHAGVRHRTGGEHAVGVGAAGGMRQFVVNRTGAGRSANSTRWLCHAVPTLPLRWA